MEQIKTGGRLSRFEVNVRNLSGYIMVDIQVRNLKKKTTPEIPFRIHQLIVTKLQKMLNSPKENL